MTIDKTYVVQQEGSQQLHDTSVVHDFDVLRSGSRLRDSLNEFHSRLLVFLKMLEH